MEDDLNPFYFSTSIIFIDDDTAVPLTLKWANMLKQGLILIALSACLFDRSLNNSQISKRRILDVQFHVPTSCVFLKALFHKTFKQCHLQLTGQQ